MLALADVSPRPLFGANLEASVIEALAEKGWAIAEGALEPELVWQQGLT